MARRKRNLTDESHTPINSSVAEDANVPAQYLAASIVSTSSSFARRSRSVKHLVDTQNYEEIGAGLQGIIYERLGSTIVTKKERTTNRGRPLRDEFDMQQSVSDAFTRCRALGSDIRVPQPFDLIPKQSLSPETLSRMPEDDQQPIDIATMERILPRPKVVRKAIIRKFHPDRDVLNSRSNKHALARVYLREKKTPPGVTRANFSLRNFHLTLDIMGELDLNVTHLATAIGWTSALQSNNDFRRRGIHLYLLDFGQCDTVDMAQDQGDIFQSFKVAMHAWKMPYLRAYREVIQMEGLLFDHEQFLDEYEEDLEEFDP
ncbi:hypothetical protein F5Y18DRAFT_419394 [Xylariaceae sp. FL1019]|nr:hypothetical protein F5Y18DRAFT_419394 [Xylariaceae sp. FL1019]